MIVLPLVLLGLLLLSASFSGSETGVYCLSRLRLDAEVRAGSRRARVLSALLRNDTALLVTLLVGNNLMLELMTHVFEKNLWAREQLPAWSHEIVVTLLLTPVIFIVGELLPKDLFRRRPHLFLTITSPLLVVARGVLFPLAWPLQLVSRGLERLFRLPRREFTRALGREEMLQILDEGTRAGALEPHAQELARGVLEMRETRVDQVMIPWDRVATVRLDGPEEAEAVRSAVEESEYTRLPVIGGKEGDARPPHVLGYLHQLDVLGNPASDPALFLRELPELAPAVPLDRALAHLRNAGQRLALVGRPDAPKGIILLMDLLAAISSAPRRGRGSREAAAAGT